MRVPAHRRQTREVAVDNDGEHGGGSIRGDNNTKKRQQQQNHAHTSAGDLTDSSIIHDVRRTQARRERARDTAGAEEQPAEEVVKGCNSVPVYLKAARANYVLQMEFQTVNAAQRIRELFLLPYFFII